MCNVQKTFYYEVQKRQYAVIYMICENKHSPTADTLFVVNFSGFRLQSERLKQVNTIETAG